MKTIVPCTICNDIPGNKCTNKMRAHVNGIRCGKCSLVLSPTAFYKHGGRSDGLSASCKQCSNAYPRKSTGKKRKTKQWVDTEHRKQYSRAFLRYFYSYPNQCKRRTKQIEFHLTIDEFYTLTHNPCIYCNGTSPNKDYVGIDRIDSNGNYTLGNCVSCCSTCNMMKRAYDTQFFISHILKIAANQ